MEWSQNRIIELRHLTDEHLSASQIAARMGVTKGAIIGKWHRLGISSGNAQGQRPAEPHPVPSAPEPAAVEALFKVPEPVEEIPSAGVTILDLRQHGCRFILGPVAGLDTLYCGQPCEVGASWCAAHTIACEDQGHPNRGRKGVGGSWKKSAISEFRI